MTAHAAPMTVHPFASAEDAWFWTMGALRARREQSGADGARIPRPCDPDDVLLCLDRLYRGQRIDLSHARVLRTWGERQEAPDRVAAAEDTRLWREALAELASILYRKGIIRAPREVGGPRSNFRN